MGGPGCGKGTNCANLVRDFGFVHLSAGDLLREEKASGSKDAELINKIINEGKIVPVEITVNLIKKAMEKHGWQDKKYLIDGFPRNDDNYQGWNSIMAEITDMRFVLFIECTKENMIARIQGRAAESGSNARSDDNLDVLNKRFDTFLQQSIPIVEIYEKENKVRKIDGNKQPEEVYQEIKQIFEEDLGKI